MGIVELSYFTIVNLLVSVCEPFCIISDFGSCVFVGVLNFQFVFSEIIISKGAFLCERNLHEFILLSV